MSQNIPRPFKHASIAHPAERLATLIDEDVGPLGSVSLLLPSQQLETVHLIALQINGRYLCCP